MPVAGDLGQVAPREVEGVLDGSVPCALHVAPESLDVGLGAAAQVGEFVGDAVSEEDEAEVAQGVLVEEFADEGLGVVGCDGHSRGA